MAGRSFNRSVEVGDSNVQKFMSQHRCDLMTAIKQISLKRHEGAFRKDRQIGKKDLNRIRATSLGV